MTLKCELTIIRHVNEMGDTMRYSKNELFLNPDVKLEFKESMESNPAWFEKMNHIIDIQDIVIEGYIIYHSYSDMIQYQMRLMGTYILPCAITLEAIPLEFDWLEEDALTIEEALSEENSFYDDKTGIDLRPIAKQVMLMEAPKKIVKANLKDYPKGKGWQVLSEAEATEKQPDPRLAKFKEFKVE